MINKTFCMSSFLAYRYIEKEDMEFYEGLKHKNLVPIAEKEKILVETVEEIDKSIAEQIGAHNEKKGLLLSGGMDSAIVASYMRGCDAYTFRFLGGEFQKEELERAEYYAKYYDMKLHYVDIDWSTVENYLKMVIKAKCAPVHSIEPQILQAALQAKKDGIELMLIGESSDLVFGGMDQLLSKDWTYEEFVQRYTFLNPADALVEWEDVNYLFERYKEGEKIDFLKFMDDVFSVDSASSFWSAFNIAEMPYMDPYARLKMKNALDLERVRNGEPKYLIRELFAKKYPEIPIPDKIPMPRPVDIYFRDWAGPTRPEFKRELDMSKFTGNQKWQLYCLEKFLNMYEPIR